MTKGTTVYITNRKKVDQRVKEVGIKLGLPKLSLSQYLNMLIAKDMEESK